jgi:carboxypeptidase Q
MTPKETATMLVVLALLCPSVSIRAQQPAKNPNDPIEKIKDEGMNRSQVMKTLEYLTDVTGPRLTASPNLKRANEWTRDQLKTWGLENSHLEAWGPFGRGWSLKSFSAEIIAPQAIPLIAFPKAWSNPTKGPVTADLVYVDVKEEKDLEKYKGTLRGKIVLSAPIRELKAEFEPPARRMTEKQLLQYADAQNPTKDSSGGPMAMASNPQIQTLIKTALFDAKKSKFFLDEGVAVVLSPSRSGSGGTIFMEDAAVPREIKATAGLQALMEIFLSKLNPWNADNPPNLPQLTIAIEHSNRLIRMAQAGEKLKARVNLDAEFHPQDLMAYNTIAEIPGGDKKDEIVMVGAHMDSWHSGTGATDNAAGCAAAMEAVRILKALKFQPRRTIRIGLWSGEEQGLLGSRAYVKDHLGVRSDDGTDLATMAAMMGGGPPAKISQKPEFEKFSVYFNLDNGTGKIRGVYLQGNEAVRPIFRDWLAP